MKVHQAYTPEESVELTRSLGEGGAPPCPRCGGPVDLWTVSPRSDVSYVRDRIRVVCPACRLTAVLERRDLG